MIAPEGGPHTSFAMFAQVTGSGRLTEPTTLAQLWASNPKLEVAPGLGQECDRVIELNRIGSGEWFPRARLTGDVASALPSDASAATTELRRRLAPYPDAAEVSVVGLAGADVQVEWRSEDGTPRSVDLATKTLGPNTGAYLVPALNGSSDVLEHFAVWWAVLLALSSIARYHPDRWTAALLRDRSKLAIPIEEGLDIAREMLPWLLLTALSAPGQG